MADEKNKSCTGKLNDGKNILLMRDFVFVDIYNICIFF